MSMRFSIFTKVITVVLIIAMCAVIVPSTANAHISSEPCHSEWDSMWNALEAGFWGCGASFFGCAAAIAAGGPFGFPVCLFAVGGCMYLARQAANKIVAYWDCKNRYQN